MIGVFLELKRAIWAAMPGGEKTHVNLLLVFPATVIYVGLRNWLRVERRIS